MWVPPAQCGCLGRPVVTDNNNNNNNNNNTRETRSLKHTSAQVGSSNQLM